MIKVEDNISARLPSAKLLSLVQCKCNVSHPCKLKFPRLRNFKNKKTLKIANQFNNLLCKPVTAYPNYHHFNLYSVFLKSVRIYALFFPCIIFKIHVYFTVRHTLIQALNFHHKYSHIPKLFQIRLKDPGNGIKYQFSVN